MDRRPLFLRGLVAFAVLGAGTSSWGATVTYKLNKLHNDLQEVAATARELARKRFDDHNTHGFHLRNLGKGYSVVTHPATGLVVKNVEFQGKIYELIVVPNKGELMIGPGDYMKSVLRKKDHNGTVVEIGLGPKDDSPGSKVKDRLMGLNIYPPSAEPIYIQYKDWNLQALRGPLKQDGTYTVLPEKNLAHLDQQYHFRKAHWRPPIALEIHGTDEVSPNDSIFVDALRQVLKGDGVAMEDLYGDDGGPQVDLHPSRDGTFSMKYSKEFTGKGGKRGKAFVIDDYFPIPEGVIRYQSRSK